MSYSPLTFKPTQDGYLIGTDFFLPLYRVVRQRDGRLVCPCKSFETSQQPKSCKHLDYIRRQEILSALIAGRIQQDSSKRIANYAEGKLQEARV